MTNRDEATSKVAGCDASDVSVSVGLIDRDVRWRLLLVSAMLLTTVFVWETLGSPPAHAAITYTRIAGIEPEEVGTGDGGPATAVDLGRIEGVTTDASSNIFFSDSLGRIRRIDAATGILSTVGGSAATGLSGDGGPAVDALFAYPSALDFDATGNLLVADRWNYRIRSISPAGIVTTVAGTGCCEETLTPGPATAASLGTIAGLAAAPGGGFYVASSDRIKFVDGSGQLSLYAGNGACCGDAGDGGPALAASFGIIRGLAVGPDGSIYVASNDRVRRIAAGTTTMSTVAGGGTCCDPVPDGPDATAGTLSNVTSVAVSPDGASLLIAEGSRVRQVAIASGAISTAAGTGFFGSAADAAGFEVTSPQVAFGEAGEAVLGDERIIVIDEGGSALVGGQHEPSLDGAPVQALGSSVAPLVEREGTLFLAADDVIVRIDGDVLSVVAGTGVAGNAGDGGLATAARLRSVRDMAFGPDGTLYVSDGGHSVRAIDPVTSIISTVAGVGEPSDAAEGLWNPNGIAVGADGTLYIADQSNNRVQKVTPGGAISTLAGNGSAGYSGDGGTATAAQLASPRDVAVIGSDVFIADGNPRIRRVSAGTITTVAGDGGFGPAIVGADPLATPANVSQLVVSGSDLLAAASQAVVRFVPGPVQSRYDGAAYRIEPSDGSSVLVVGAGAVGVTVRRLAPDGTSEVLLGLSGGLNDLDGLVAVDTTVPRLTNMVVDDLGKLYLVHATAAVNTLVPGPGATFENLSMQFNSRPAAGALPDGSILLDARTKFVQYPSSSGDLAYGSGPCGSSGDGGPAASAELCAVASSVDGAGNVTFVNALTNFPNPSTYSVRRIDATSGTITTLASLPDPGCCQFEFYVDDVGTVFTHSTTGPTSALTVHAIGKSPVTHELGKSIITAAGGPDGHVYVAIATPIGYQSYSDWEFVRIAPDGSKVTVDGIPTEHLAVGPTGSLFVSRTVTYDIFNAGTVVYQVDGIPAPTSPTTTTTATTTTTTQPATTTTTTQPATGDGPAIVAVVPARLLETRIGPNNKTVDGLFQGIGKLGAGSVTQLTVAGRGGVPLDAESVFLNVTIIQPQGPGHVTVWPCGEQMPNSSNLNYKPGDVVPNGVVSKIGAAGTVCVFTLAGTEMVVDLTGYAPSGSPVGTLVPARLMETRSGPTAKTIDGQFLGGGRLPAGAVTQLVIAGRGGVPSDASTAFLNVTAIQPQGPGFITVWPCGEAMPNSSNLNYKPGDVVPNWVVAKIGASGRACIFNHAATDLVVDVTGFVPAGDSVGTLVPARLMETRSGPTSLTIDGQFQGIGQRAATSVTELQVGGRGGVPTDASAVFLNVTVVGPQGPGYVTVWPCGQTMPTSSNLNYKPGDVVPNGVLAKLGTAGKVCIYTYSTTHMIVDVSSFVPATDS